MWYYNDEPFNMSEEDLENYQGFVYEVTELETGMKYIGKKFFWKKKVLPKNKSRKRRVITRVQSDWQTYYGSSAEVKQLAEQGFQFTRKILQLCRTKGECSYYEAKLQFDNDVLLRNDYFNEFIGCKIHSKFIKEMKNDYFKRTNKS